MAEVIIDKQPNWCCHELPENLFDRDCFKIIKFYVIESPCSDVSVRSIPLQRYGWKDKPWSPDHYLKNKLNKDVFLDKKNVFCAVDKIEEMSRALNKTYLGNPNYFLNIKNEKAAFYKSKKNEYMSLFYHIRCSLAHGRFTIVQNEDNTFFIMENGIKSGSGFLLKARMIIKKNTLLKWIDILQQGPDDSELVFYRDVLYQIKDNNKITKKELAKIFGEIESGIEKAIKFLKKNNIVKYERVGRNGFWSLDLQNAEKCFKNQNIEFKY